MGQVDADAARELHHRELAFRYTLCCAEGSLTIQLAPMPLAGTVSPPAVVVAPARVFAPIAAVSLFNSNNAELLDRATTPQRRGVAECWRVAHSSAPRADVTLTCDVQGFAWRRATVTFSFVHCSDRAVAVRSAMLEGFRVLHRREVALGLMACPGDDAGLLVVE